MRENEVNEVKAVPAIAAKPDVKAAPKKVKKKDKKPVATPEAIPHVTGRLQSVEVGADGVEFAVKGKKGKAEIFSLQGMEPSAVPAAAALLAGLVVSKAKLRVEYAMTGENSRTVKNIGTQG
jgi:hypothetical protein